MWGRSRRKVAIIRIKSANLQHFKPGFLRFFPNPCTNSSLTESLNSKPRADLIRSELGSRISTSRCARLALQYEELLSIHVVQTTYTHGRLHEATTATATTATATTATETTATAATATATTATAATATAATATTTAEATMVKTTAAAAAAAAEATTTATVAEATTTATQRLSQQQQPSQRAC